MQVALQELAVLLGDDNLASGLLVRVVNDKYFHDVSLLPRNASPTGGRKPKHL